MAKQEHATSPLLNAPLPIPNHVEDIPRAPLHALPNGNKEMVEDKLPSGPLAFVRPRPDEKEVEAELARIEAAELGDLDPQIQATYVQELEQRHLKRVNDVEAAEEGKRKVSRHPFERKLIH
jgi:DNA helicase INO80